VFPVTTYFLEDALVQCNFKGLGNKSNVGEPMIDWGEDITYSDDSLSKLWLGESTDADLMNLFPLTNNSVEKKENNNRRADGGNHAVECSICGGMFSSVDELGEHVALCFGEPIEQKTVVVSSVEIPEETKRKNEIATILNRYLAGCGDEDDVDLNLIHQLLKYVIDFEIKKVAENGTGGGGGGGGSGGGGKKNKKNKKQIDPSQWIEVVDPESGESYYWNQITNETSWEKPVSTAAASGGNKSSNYDHSNVYGAVLVFLPGWMEISSLKLLLDSDTNLGDVLVLPLHRFSDQSLF
jgi:hypothetical protein